MTTFISIWRATGWMEVDPSELGFEATRARQGRAKRRPGAPPSGVVPRSLAKKATDTALRVRYHTRLMKYRLPARQARLFRASAFATATAWCFNATAEWTQVATLTHPTELGGDAEGWGQGSLACSGDTILVGAAQEDEYTGAVYSFSGEAYAQKQRWVPADHHSSDEFGTRVSISGDSAAITSDRSDDRVSFYKREAGQWQHQQTVMSMDAADLGDLGRQLTIYGDFALVASPGEDASAGAAYIYENEGGTWVEKARLEASDRFDGDHFSLTIDFDGTTAIAAMPGSSTSGVERGSAYLFSRNAGGQWALEAELSQEGRTPAPPALAYAGGVAVSGDYAAVRATAGTDAELPDRLFIYERGDGSWPLVHTLIAEPAESLGPPTLQGDRLLVQRTVDGHRSIQEYQRAAQWAPTQSIPLAGAAVGFALCGPTLVLGRAGELLVYKDTSIHEDPPSGPVGSQDGNSGGSAAGDTESQQGCTYSPLTYPQRSGSGWVLGLFLALGARLNRRRSWRR
jgi:hypothetical protein